MSELTPERRLTVAICTRDRGDSICATLDSVLAAGDELSEVIVVDQSHADDTAQAIEPYLSDQRLTLIRSELKGVSNSRNLALERSSNDLVFMTDDDCVLPVDYAPRAIDVFEAYPIAAAIYLRVDPAPFDPSLGFIPVFVPTVERTLTSVSQLKQSSGIAAGLLLRREAVAGIGGFDAYLGPGGVFSSAEDVDLTVRLLLAGREVVETTQLAVVHHGFRSNDQFRQLVRRDWVGIGAAYAKPMRSKYRRQFAPVLCIDVWRRSLAPFLRNLLRLSPYGIASFVAFLRGYSAGMRQPIDQGKLLYRDFPANHAS